MSITLLRVNHHNLRVQKSNSYQIQSHHRSNLGLLNSTHRIILGCVILNTIIFISHQEIQGGTLPSTVSNLTYDVFSIFLILNILWSLNFSRTLFQIIYVNRVLFISILLTSSQYMFSCPFFIIIVIVSQKRKEKEKKKSLGA